MKSNNRYSQYYLHLQLLIIYLLRVLLFHLIRYLDYNSGVNQIQFVKLSFDGTLEINDLTKDYDFNFLILNYIHMIILLPFFSFSFTFSTLSYPFSIIIIILFFIS